MLVEQQASSQHLHLISLQIRLRGDRLLKSVVDRQKSGVQGYRNKISLLNREIKWIDQTQAFLSTHSTDISVVHCLSMSQS